MQKFSVKQQQIKFNSTSVKSIIHHDQMGFNPGMQGRFNTQNPKNVTHHINRMKDKKQIIFLIGTEKASGKKQHPFMIKNAQQIGHKRNLPQHNKDHI